MRDVEVDYDALAETLRRCGRHRLQLCLGRQCAEHAVEHDAHVRRIDVAHDRDFEAVARKCTPDIILEVIGCDQRQRFKRAADIAAVRMVRERDFPPASGSDLAGARCIAPQTGKDLRPHTFDRVRVEAGRGQRQPQKRESVVAIVVQCAQGSAEIIAAGAEIDLDRPLFKFLGEGLGVEIAGAFVEQTSSHIGDAELVGGVLAGTPAKSEFKRYQRRGRLAHQPSLDPTGADHAFDRHRAGRRGQGKHRQPGQRHAGRDGFHLMRERSAHERFSSGCARSFTR